ncbi:unnamed protein product, partial [marine sediment metagenome]
KELFRGFFRIREFWTLLVEQSYRVIICNAA